MSVVEIFEQICKIPRCSYKTEKIVQFIKDVAKEHHYEVNMDEAQNILVSSKNSKVTLQAHMDMVCIGAYEDMQLEINDGVMSAKNSTLGADNAMAVAMMIALMQEHTEVDFLFTNDEEVGLVGARALALDIRTPYLLNLDSEDEGVLTLGCAGGVDIVARKKLEHKAYDGNIYKLVCSGYEGGHSGVDIHLNIKNAIKELGLLLDESEFDIVDIKGGERRNSIAKYAEATVVSAEKLDLEKVESSKNRVIENSQEIAQIINGFSHGVHSFNKELNIVQTSINLAKISTDDETLSVELTARSMSKKELDLILEETNEYFERFGFEMHQSDYYEPWEIEDSAFSALVMEAAKGLYAEVEVSAIHAGLECGILKKKSPDVLMCSIGPTIRFPHSTRENVDLASVERTYQWVKNILSKTAS